MSSIVLVLDASLLLAGVWVLNVMQEDTCQPMRLAFLALLAGVLLDGWYYLLASASPCDEHGLLHVAAHVAIQGGTLTLILFDRRSRRRVCCLYESRND